VSDLAPHIGKIARALLGEENRQLSTRDELRFGTNGSVSVDLANGRWYCHETQTGGGTFELVTVKGQMQNGAAFDWLRGLGIEVEPTGKKPGRMIATYDYVDETGGLLFQVCRFDPKTFRQRRPDGRGGWDWSVEGIRRVPYRLPELVAAADLTVHIVEGEKDADALAALGLIATCNPGGAAKRRENGRPGKPKWRPEFAQYFRDRDVVILPDNDDAGRDHAHAVAGNLAPVARSVRIVELPGLEPKGDVSDWLAAGRTVEDLGWIAEGVDPFELGDAPEADTVEHHSNGKAPESRFKLIRFSDIELGIDRAYLVKGLIPKDSLTVVYGSPKCGKTFWTFDLGMHIALGREYRGHLVEYGSVVYIASEGQRGLTARAVAFQKKRMTPEDDPPFHLLATRLDLVNDVDVLGVDIASQLGAGKCSAIVIDTLNRTFKGSESKDEDMTAYIRAADKLRERFGCAVIIIHHCGISDTRPRGHTSLTGAVDAQIAVKRDALDQIVATVEWMKDGPEGEEIVSRLNVVEVGINEDGDPITSCVIEPVDARASTPKPAKKPTGAASVGLEQLKNCMADHAVDLPASNHIPKGARGVTLFEWRGYLQKAGVINEEGSYREQFKRIRVTLQSGGFIGVWDEFVWVVT
jgi:hypothetical protein